MPSDYVSLQELKNSSELFGFSFADYDAQLALTAASRGVDEYTGRRFYPDGDTTSVRYYSPTDLRHIQIDDLVSLGTVATDTDGDGVFETEWTLNTDFVLSPLNAAADGKPYEEIRVHPASSLYFPCWARSTQVTGQFGWPSIPAPVKEATSIIASRLLRRVREAPFGILGIGVDNVAVRIARVDPDVSFLLDPYVSGSGVLAA